ncbi:hypothetical protein EJB05_34208, partial [Eragrostis curvula]
MGDGRGRLGLGEEVPEDGHATQPQRRPPEAGRGDKQTSLTQGSPLLSATPVAAVPFFRVDLSSHRFGRSPSGGPAASVPSIASAFSPTLLCAYGGGGRRVIQAAWRTAQDKQ